MADNWQVGDLAECIDVKDFEFTWPDGFPGCAAGGRDLTLGMIYIVRDVAADPDGGGLVLEVGTKTGPKAAHRFRRIPPLAEKPPVTLEARRARELMDG